MTARRSRGDGSLFWDSERKVWVGVVSLGRDPDTGRRSRRKVSAPTKTECRVKLAELADAQRRAGAVPRGNLTVADVVREFMEHPPARWRSQITLDTNQDHADRITAALGTVKVTRLSVPQVERMLEGMLDDGYSASTISRTRSILARALRRAQRDHGLARNVAQLADLPGGTRRVSRAMTMDQVRELLASELSPWWRAWITTAVMTGLRPGELSGLRWSDVDFDAGVVRVRQSLKRGQAGDLKTPQSRRTIRMPSAVAAALKALKAEQARQRLALGSAYTDLGLAFAREDGKGVHRDRVRTGLASCCAAAGISSYTPREMRHTFVSALSDSGMTIEQIADAVGHVNSTITKTVYRHQIRDEITSAAVTWDALAGES